jgi:hypothetical protein
MPYGMLLAGIDHDRFIKKPGQPFLGLIPKKKERKS